MAQSIDIEAGAPGRRRRHQTRWVVISIVMWAIGLLFLLPFAWMLISSFKREIDIFRLPVTWIPNPATIANYLEVTVGPQAIWRYFVNSILVAVARVAGDLLTASLAAYGFSRLRFRGRDALFFLYISTLAIPFQVLLVPRFILFHEVGLYDTLWALILPGAFTVFGTFLLRQFFLGIPMDLSDAARLDGANEFQIYARIIVPLARPALASLAILAFVWSWNDYETPLIMLTTNSKYTIPIGLTNFMDVSGGLSAGPIMAASVLSLIPIFALFLVLQRQFVQAITRSGLKG